MADERNCRHVFDPAEHETASPERYEAVIDEDGVWTCPHATDPGEDLCVFHRDPADTDPARVTEELRARIAESDGATTRFLDARMGRADLTYAVLEGPTNAPIDLRHATVEGDVDLSAAVVGQRLLLDDATIRGSLRCRSARFHGVVSLEAATVEGTVDATDAEFDREVYGSHARFDGGVRLLETAFDGGAYFNGATFAADLDGHVARFGGRADFSESTVANAQFPRATFADEVRFDDCAVESGSFVGARFHDLAYFDGVRLPRRLSFGSAEFTGVASFTELRAHPEGSTVVLADALVAEGRLYRGEGSDLGYDLKDATVGDVRLSDGTHAADLLDGYRFLNTTFDGFDFGAYRDVLSAVDWRLDEAGGLPAGSSGVRPTAASPADRESTFLKAKNGATQIGDTAAAAEFFRLEMLCRRHGHRERATDAERSAVGRLRASWRWLGNLVVGLTSGYGERPARVVFTAVATVVVFAASFGLLLPAPPHGHPVGFLLLSVESFVTLVHAGGAPIEDPWIRLLGVTEGFVGAFLIALFVFTLTRSIHR